MKLVFVYALTALFIVGCDIEPLQMPRSPVVTPTGFEEGEYVEDCLNDEDGNDKSSQETIKFEDDGFVRTWSKFDGVDCAANRKSSLFVYNYTNMTELPEIEIKDWQTYQYKTGKFTVTAFFANLVTKFNQDKAYGYNNWQQNVSQEINDRKYGEKTTYTFPKIGTIFKSTFKREDNKVMMARYVEDQAVSDDPRVFKKR